MEHSFCHSRLLAVIIFAALFGYTLLKCAKRGEKCWEYTDRFHYKGCCGTDVCPKETCERCRNKGETAYYIGLEGAKFSVHECCEDLLPLHTSFLIKRDRACARVGQKTDFERNCCPGLDYDGNRCVKKRPFQCFSEGDDCKDLNKRGLCCNGLYCNKLNRKKTYRCGKECLAFRMACEYHVTFLDHHDNATGHGGCCEHFFCVSIFRKGKRIKQQCLPCVEAGGRCNNGQMCCSGHCVKNKCEQEKQERVNCIKHGERCSIHKDTPDYKQCCRKTDLCFKEKCERCRGMGEAAPTFSGRHWCCQGLIPITTSPGSRQCGHCVGVGHETKFGENCCKPLVFNGKKCVTCLEEGDDCSNTTKGFCCKGLHCNKPYNKKTDLCSKTCAVDGQETKFKENCCKPLVFNGKKCVKPCIAEGNDCSNAHERGNCCKGLYCNKLNKKKTYLCGKECLAFTVPCEYRWHLRHNISFTGNGGCCGSLRCVSTFTKEYGEDQQCFPCAKDNVKCHNGQMCCSGFCKDMKCKQKNGEKEDLTTLIFS